MVFTGTIRHTIFPGRQRRKFACVKRDWLTQSWIIADICGYRLNFIFIFWPATSCSRAESATATEDSPSLPRMIENGVACLDITQKIDKRNLISLWARDHMHDEGEIGGGEPRPTIRPDHSATHNARWQRLWQARLLTAAMHYRNRYLCLEQHAGS